AYQVATGALSPGESSLGRPTAHSPARTPRPPVYPDGAERKRVDARGDQAGPRRVCPRGDELDRRRPAGRCRAPRNEADDSSVVYETARDRAPFLIRGGRDGAAAGRIRVTQRHRRASLPRIAVLAIDFLLSRKLRMA